MASDQNFVDFVTARIQTAGTITAKKMFGEYGIYCDGKLFAMICDNKLFIKPTDEGRSFIGNPVEAQPYYNAKLNFLITDKIQDSEWLSKLVRITVDNLPEPKQKPKPKSKKNQKGLLLILLLICQLSLHAQPSPEALLSRLPSVPTVKCDADRTEIDDFLNSIYLVKTDLQTIIDKMQTDAAASAAEIEAKIRSGALPQAGINVAEMEKVAAMSEEELIQWAQAHADQLLEESQNSSFDELQMNSARLFELAQEQQALSEQITNKNGDLQLLLLEVNEQDKEEYDKLREQITPLEKQLCSGICTDAEIARSNTAEKQIYNLRISYCQKMSPLLSAALSEYLTGVKSLFPDYRRLAEVQNEMATLQDGVGYPVDISCYAAVDDYADVLLDAYKYWVGKFRK